MTPERADRRFRLFFQRLIARIKVSVSETACERFESSTYQYIITCLFPNIFVVNYLFTLEFCFTPEHAVVEVTQHPR